MHITRLECDSCNTLIESKFDICIFCQLPKEQKAFLEVFIKNRGNIKDCVGEGARHLTSDGEGQSGCGYSVYGVR